MTKITKQVVLQDLKRVARKTKGTTLTREEYRANGNFSSWLVEARFGTWAKAVAKV